MRKAVPSMDKRAERGRATRDQLVGVATELFAQRGFDGTSIEAVLEQAGVSRGSLYHHFASKEALFAAALDAVEAHIGEETNALLATLGETDALGALRAGSLAWIRLAGDPVVQRIVLIDAPAVLGWERWRAIEEENALGTIKVVMQMAADEGRITADLVDTFAHVLLATMNELALLIARASDTQAAQRDAEKAVDEILTRLLG
ncbi:MAG TPA: TetR/AcrR family transcriptional regulator [Acidimicrobiia bacterium]|nr:TetR/AcrR family transcriptional regulator [Acidimicrobiia bacterium]